MTTRPSNLSFVLGGFLSKNYLREGLPFGGFGYLGGVLNPWKLGQIFACPGGGSVDIIFIWGSLYLSWFWPWALKVWYFKYPFLTALLLLFSLIFPHFYAEWVNKKYKRERNLLAFCPFFHVCKSPYKESNKGKRYFFWCWSCKQES